MWPGSVSRSLRRNNRNTPIFLARFSRPPYIEFSSADASTIGADDVENDYGTSGRRARAASLSIRRGRLHRQHLQVRRPANADPALRSCERHADALQGTAEVEGLGVGHCQAVHPAKGADPPPPAGPPPPSRPAS